MSADEPIPEARLVSGDTGAKVSSAAPPLPAALPSAKPRTVPLGLKLQVWLGDRVAVLGWLLMLAALVATSSMARDVRFHDVVYDRTAIATISAVQTEYVKNGPDTYRVSYFFVDTAGEIHEGTSIAASPRNVYSTHSIEYSSVPPFDSRMDGMDATTVSAGIFIGCCALGIAGTIVVLVCLRARRGDVRVLATGDVATGRIATKAAALLRSFPIREHRYTIEYAARDATTYLVTTRWLKLRREIGDAELVLCDPSRPQRGLALGFLAGRPSITPDGNFDFALTWACLGILLPLLASFALASSIVTWLRICFAG